MIKAIVFDYGNVIARFDHLLFFKRMFPFSSMTVAEIQDEARREPNLIVSYETGLISSDEFAAQVVKRLKLSVPKQEFKESFTDIFERFPATVQLIQQLKSSYRLGLLSNTNEWHFEAEIKTIDVFPLFDSVTLSFKLGAMKPSEILYRDALDKLGMQADECVYIDDIEEYVRAAQNIGFHAICYTSHEQLVSSLLSLGVNPR